MELEEISVSGTLKHQSRISCVGTYDFKSIVVRIIACSTTFPYLVPTLLCDNLSVVMLFHNSILHTRTKHIELEIHFVRDKMVDRRLLIQHVPTYVQIAGLLTKPLSTALFSNFWTKLNVSSLAPP